MWDGIAQSVILNKGLALPLQCMFFYFICPHPSWILSFIQLSHFSMLPFIHVILYVLIFKTHFVLVVRYSVMLSTDVPIKFAYMIDPMNMFALVLSSTH